MTLHELNQLQAGDQVSWGSKPYLDSGLVTDICWSAITIKWARSKETIRYHRYGFDQHIAPIHRRDEKKQKQVKPKQSA